MPSVKKVSQAEFARLNGWDRSYVTQLKKSGRIVITADGLVDVNASEIRLKETADPNRDDVVARHAEKRGKKSNKPDDEVTIKFSDARAKEQHFKALQAELDFKKAMGELVSVDDMKNAVGDVVTLFRSSLENMPHRLSADLVGKDIDDIRLLLKQAINTTLNEMERSFGQKLNGMVG